MNLKKMNESLEAIEAVELKESTQKEKLAKVLDAVCFGLTRKGEKGLKAYEVAFQDAIERVYPDKPWWETTTVNIFSDLIETRNPKKTAENVVAGVKEEKEEIKEAKLTREEAIKSAEEFKKKFPDAKHIVYGLLQDNKYEFFTPFECSDEEYDRLARTPATKEVYALHNSRREGLEENYNDELIQATAEEIHKEHPEMGVSELFEYIRDKYDIYEPAYNRAEVEMLYNACKDAVGNRYEVIARKTVADSDGFDTEYTLYKDTAGDRFVTVFGDSDIYRPEDEEFDAEFDTEEQAREWFDNYKGFEEDEESAMWFNDDFDESLNEAKQISREYIAEGDYEGHHYTVIATQQDTKNYRWEDIDIKEDYADIVGTGRYKWLNRPWQKYTFAEAMKKALVSWFGAQATDKAEEAVESSHTIQEAFDKFMELIKWKKNEEMKNESYEEDNENELNALRDRHDAGLDNDMGPDEDDRHEEEIETEVPLRDQDYPMNAYYDESIKEEVADHIIYRNDNGFIREESEGEFEVYHYGVTDEDGVKSNGSKYYGTYGKYYTTDNNGHTHKAYYDDAFEEAKKALDESKECSDESLNEEKGNVFVDCPECGKRNRVNVEFKAFNKPFEDTKHKCEFCGADFDVYDNHEYNDDGTIKEEFEDDCTLGEVTPRNTFKVLDDVFYCDTREEGMFVDDQELIDEFTNAGFELHGVDLYIPKGSVLTFVSDDFVDTYALNGFDFEVAEWSEESRKTPVKCIKKQYKEDFDEEEIHTVDWDRAVRFTDKAELAKEVSRWIMDEDKILDAYNAYYAEEQGNDYDEIVDNLADDFVKEHDIEDRELLKDAIKSAINEIGWYNFTDEDEEENFN